MDLDLDTLAALEAAAPASVAADGTKPHLVAAAKFYRAWKEAAPALIAAAREREGLPRLAWHNDAARVVAEREALAARVGELDRALTETFTNAQRVAEQRDATCAELREVYSVHGELAHEGLRRLRAAVAADDRYHALARAVRAQASAQAAATRSDSASWVDFVSADVARLLEEVRDGE